MQIPNESPEQHYRDALAANRFEIQQCTGCRRHVFPPRIACPVCGGVTLEWHEASGNGVVHACTVVSRTEEKGGPYNVVLVDLDEGVRLMSHVAGYDGWEVPVGLPVRARIEPDAARLVFEPAGEIAQ